MSTTAPIRIGPPGDDRREGVNVYASPVAAYVAPRVEKSAAQVTEGLANVGTAVDAKADVFAKEERASGIAAARNGATGEQAQKKGGFNFLQGFTIGSAEAAAVLDSKEMEAAYDAEVDKQGGNVNGFLQAFYQKKIGNMEDGFYRQAYDAVFSQSAARLREKHGETMANGIIETNRTNANIGIAAIIDGSVFEHGTVTSDAIAKVNEVALRARLSHVDKDALTFQAVKAWGDKGNPDVYAAMREKRVDADTGRVLPALYDNPKYRDQIDKAEDHARRERIRLHKEEQTTLKEQREQELNDAQGAAYDALFNDGDPAKAREKFAEILKDPRYRTDIKGLLSAQAAFESTLARTVKPGEREAEDGLMAQVFEGKLSMKQINETDDVGLEAKQRLRGALNSVMSQARRDAAMARATEAQILQMTRATQESPESRMAIEAYNGGTKFGVDKFGIEDSSMEEKAMRQQGLTSLRLWLLDNGKNVSTAEKIDFANRKRDEFQKNLAESRKKSLAAATSDASTTNIQSPRGRLKALNDALSDGAISVTDYNSQMLELQRTANKPKQ